MDAEAKEKVTESVGKILERIRARLREQNQSDVAAGPGASSTNGSVKLSVPELRLLLVEAQALQDEIGKINPRLSGVFNDLVQLFKRVLRRALGWYTRSLVRYHLATIRFLAAVTDILDRDQGRLQNLEARVDLLTSQLAVLRQDTLAQLEWIAQEMAKRDQVRS